jgi:signal transduction histidine kinase
VVTGGAAAAVLLAGRIVRGDDPAAAAYSASAAQWVLVALISGVLAARIHGLSAAPSPMDRYAEARRLLAQLRAVTRGLDGSLDPGTVAQTLMAECNAVARAEHGAVLLHVGGDQLVPLAVHGYQRVPWRADLAEDGPITRAWLRGRRSSTAACPTPPAAACAPAAPCSSCRSPWVTAASAWWRSSGAPLTATTGAEQRPALAEASTGHALPLETAALFDELRIAAATEERSRLAREMHDGIAQDLAFLGYQLDALTAVCSGRAAERACSRHAALRAQHDLAHQRPAAVDLRPALERRAGRGSGPALSSTPARRHELGHQGPPEPEGGQHPAAGRREVQLLRIAHEAVGRARAGQARRTCSSRSRSIRPRRASSSRMMPRTRQKRSRTVHPPTGPCTNVR